MAFSVEIGERGTRQLALMSDFWHELLLEMLSLPMDLMGKGEKIDRDGPVVSRILSVGSIGFVPSETQILDAVRALHEAGNDTVTVAMVLEHFEPGYTAKAAATAKTVNVVDAVGPSINNLLAKAGRAGALTVDTAEDGLVTVRFPATTGS